jgi:hypothetical protein
LRVCHRKIQTVTQRLPEIPGCVERCEQSLVSTPEAGNHLPEPVAGTAVFDPRVTWVQWLGIYQVILMDAGRVQRWCVRWSASDSTHRCYHLLEQAEPAQGPAIMSRAGSRAPRLSLRCLVPPERALSPTDFIL